MCTTPVQLHYNSTIIPIKTLKTCIFKIMLYICRCNDKVINQNQIYYDTKKPYWGQNRQSA